MEGTGSKPPAPARRTSARISSWFREPVSALSAAYVSVSPTVTVGPTWTTAQRTAGSRDAASGMIQPAWLPPERPTRRGSTSGCAARYLAAAAASRARTSRVESLARSPGYTPPDWPTPRLS